MKLKKIGKLYQGLFSRYLASKGIFSVSALQELYYELRNSMLNICIDRVKKKIF